MRIIIIDDNLAIHQDFIKVLTKTQETSSDAKFEELDKEIFGEETTEESLLPTFEIDTASQGQEGVSKIKLALEEGRAYALAFVDIRMPPGWDGIETIKRIWELDENIQIVICTAYSDYSWEKTVKELGQTDNLLILKKPFDSVAVRQLACALTKKWQLMQQSKEHLNFLEEKIKERTQSLQKSLSLTRATLESATDGILVVDSSNKIVDFNNKFIDMWKIPRVIHELRDYDILLEYLLNQLINPESFLAKTKELSIQTDKIDIQELSFKDGRIFECYSQPQKIHDKSIGRVWSYRDITKRVHMENKLIYQASHDELTGLYNRFAIMEVIFNSLDKNDNNKKMALLFLDLDRFKLINDSLGHAAGDDLIQQFANRLSSIHDLNVSVARLGGDEFLIFVPEYKNDNELDSYAKKLLTVLAEPYNIMNRSIVITASIGISVSPKDGATPDELLRAADSAMYFSKQLGSNQYQYYTDTLNVKALERLDQEAELREAIARNQLMLVYQPQYDAINGKLSAVEALIRWNHPTKGVILPFDFIPLAEETGLIIQIGEWVLRTACKQNKQWQNDGLVPIRVAVNVASQQFKLQNFVEIVASVLEETGLSPKYLEIEVTENTIISDPIVISSIVKLKELGVLIMLDDFGTGYSSLNYLKKIPLDGLKIDKSFIENIQVSRDDEVIIRAIIAMAHNLNLEVVAEGVETSEQLKFLKANYCKDIQGFHFSEPLPPDQLEKLLQKSKDVIT